MGTLQNMPTLTPTPSMAEKSGTRTPPESTPERKPAPPPTRAQRALLTLFKLCTLLICAVAIRSAYNPEPLLRLPDFFGKHKHKHKHPHRWDAGKPVFRTPDATLGWHKCPDNPANQTFYCAFFDAPLNWNEVEENPDEKDWRKWKGGDKVVDTARIFLRMYPATSPDRLGSMLFNPGGPGGSGNAFLYRLAEEFSNITEGRYDLIGFDPRGVNMTSPRMKTHDNAYAQALFKVANQPPVQEGDPTNPVNTSIPEQFDREYARLAKIQQLGETQFTLVRNFTTEKERKSVSTPFMVRDLAAIVDALGDKDRLLNYWGFSYGTILGAHFAAIKPERVGRLVLDGVSHSGDYTGSLEAWGQSSMTDTFKTYEQFFLECVKAGTARCALAERVPAKLDDETDEAYIPRAAFSLMIQTGEFLNALWKKPLVVKESKYGPGIVTAEQVSLALGQMLYQPVRWQGVAIALHEAMNGNATLARDYLPQPWHEALVADPEKARRLDTDNVFGEPVAETDSAIFSILCSDQPAINEDALGDLVHLSGDLLLKSPLAPLWMLIMTPCTKWADRPYERYPGPWTRKEGLRKPKNPILWIGNTYDPVTPLASAQRMVEGFGPDSSRLLVHDGRGHCTSAEPSLCTGKALSDFFVRGILPAEGTVCKAEEGFIFPDKNATLAVAGADAQLYDVLRRIAERQAEH
ncbi:Putative hydrolase [Vanrija pseudolonga]|uniref:Hydrolase n=1 Tax=Vanrija pseudolonga TaxID=143232 RepID=A0AAF0Y8G4_9TREE|nr:Putative hydrolase [Vanrija pseudolonga]